MKRVIPVVFVLMLILLSSCTVFTVPVVIQFEGDCAWEDLVPGDIRLQIESEDSVIIGTDIDPDAIEILLEDACVIKLLTKEDLQDALQSLQSELDEDRDAKIKEVQLDRTLKRKDILDKDDLEEYVDEENPELEGGIISSYQYYVTPDDTYVQSLADEYNGIQEIYDASLAWVWISDTDLWGESEHWMYPEEFLTETPDMNTNPTGELASDCEEQANTLASVLIAEGYSSQDVRVVLGEVDFSGTVGGHAWVQVYEDGGWLDVEATSGAYYTEEDGYVSAENVDIPYDYFQYHTYPSIDIWYYYNNDFFMNADTGSGNAPSHWSEEGGSWLERDLTSFQRGQRAPSRFQGGGAVVYPLAQRQQGFQQQAVPRDVQVFINQ